MDYHGHSWMFVASNRVDATAKRGHIVAVSVIVPFHTEPFSSARDTKFAFATDASRVAKRVNIWETYCRHNVSRLVLPEP